MRGKCVRKVILFESGKGKKGLNGNLYVKIVKGCKGYCWFYWYFDIFWRNGEFEGSLIEII